MIGGSFYCAMLASLIYILKPVFLAASCLNGIGAALLWTGEVCGYNNCRINYVARRHFRNTTSLFYQYFCDLIGCSHVILFNCRNARKKCRYFLVPTFLLLYNSNLYFPNCNQTYFLLGLFLIVVIISYISVIIIYGDFRVLISINVRNILGNSSIESDRREHDSQLHYSKSRYSF